MFSRLRFAVTSTLAFTAVAVGQSFVNWETPQVHPLALTPSGATLLVANTADNRLDIYDVSGGTPLPLRSVPVGLDPVSVRARTETEAWVVNLISDSVSIVDIPSGRVTRTLNVGDEPADVVFAGQPQMAFISLSQLNRVIMLEPANPGAAPTTIDIAGEDPRALAVSPDGANVYAAIFESGNHSTIVPRDKVSDPSGPYSGVNPPPNAGSLFVPALTPGLPQPPIVSHIVRKDSSTGKWMDGNAHDWSPLVTWDFYDHDVAIINAATKTVTYVGGLLTTVSAVGVAPDGTVMAVGTEAHNEIRFESNVTGIFIRAQAAVFNGNGGAGAAHDLNPQLDYSTPSVAPAIRDLAIGDPRGIVWNASSSIAYVAGMGSNNVIAVSSAGGRLGQVDVGAGPTGVALNPAGTRLFVLNRFDATISSINPATMTEISRAKFFDPTPVEIKEGRPFLYDTHLTSGLGQASCASCHIDGRTDHLAWDLGHPAGSMQVFEGDCLTTCEPWHPMKGPMVTQTLQGIIGNEPFHWRGEKLDLSQFNGAFKKLQAADSLLSDHEMDQFQAFISTIRFPPNPNRNLDDSLKTTLPILHGTGNPQNGYELFNTLPVNGAFTCTTCHALPTGTTKQIDPPTFPEAQNRKMAQLRNMHEKAGADDHSMTATRGFGFNHDGSAFTIDELLQIPPLFLPGGAEGAQIRRDLEAFLLSFPSDTHAGVGAQTTTSHGGGAGDDMSRLNQMTQIANSGAVGLVVKGRFGGIQRGWALINGSLQSDRASQSTSIASLVSQSAPGSELTWTLVPKGSEIRIGIDRDLDGYYDRDELDAGSDPADPASIPGSLCVGDIDHNGSVNGADLAILLGQWGGPGTADLDHNGTVNGADLAILLGAWGSCP